MHAGNSYQVGSTKYLSTCGRPAAQPLARSSGRLHGHQAPRVTKRVQHVPGHAYDPRDMGTCTGRCRPAVLHGRSRWADTCRHHPAAPRPQPGTQPRAGTLPHVQFADLKYWSPPRDLPGTCPPLTPPGTCPVAPYRRAAARAGRGHPLPYLPLHPMVSSCPLPRPSPVASGAARAGAARPAST